MTPAVWKQVIGMSVWNVIVMTAMFAKMVLNEKYIGYVLVDTDEDNMQRMACTKENSLL